MTPINLEDVERYLYKRLDQDFRGEPKETFVKQLAQYFAELRARKAAVLKTE